MRVPTLELAVRLNRAVRHDDEWFDEPDDLDRIRGAIAGATTSDDPVEVAARLVFRVTRAQGLTEGNKRTAFLLARWVLDHNDQPADRILPPEDRVLADPLVRASMEQDVEEQIVALFAERL